MLGGSFCGAFNYGVLLGPLITGHPVYRDIAKKSDCPKKIKMSPAETRNLGNVLLSIFSAIAFWVF